MVSIKSLLSAAAVTGLVSAFTDPTDNGFPNPSSVQLQAIEKLAGGTLPGGALPTSLSAGPVTALTLIRFNELFEAAYFSSLLNNITASADGYKSDHQDELVAIFTAILAQEEMHALAAGGVLKNAGISFIPSPCQYKFPVDNLEDAITLAEVFTSVVLGALQGAQVLMAEGNQTGLVQTLSSVIGQEGEQNGYYRHHLHRVPSESPFLTHVPAPFAFSALQAFIESCPFPISDVPLPVFPALTANGGPFALVDPKDQLITCTADLSGSAAAKPFIGGNGNGLYMTWTTGQQLPFSVPLCNVKWEGSVITFQANFPFEEHFMEGFSHGALTTTNSFASSDAVPTDTLAAPAIIQVEDKF